MTSRFVEELTRRPGYGGQVSHIEHIPPRKPRYGTLDKSLPTPLEECLKRKDLLPLYSHQAEAVNRIRESRNLMVATSSASGKSLCYNIPVLESVMTARDSRAIYLFPTKALAQDQLRSLFEIFAPPLLPQDVATFDGDTPQIERAGIRRQARIILTNPDMLHVGILPNHAAWARFFRNLKFVVVDEAHTYRGVFGSHVAGVLRRLRRVCRLYGARPQFIFASATIANPGEHAGALTGLPFEVVDKDGSPHGGRDFVFWNPPLTDRARTSRRSANTEASELFAALVKENIRTLTFARTRRLTELIYSYTRKKLAESAPDQAEKIRPYRAGYLAAERRRIERELFTGELTGVVATTALELGIDIGDLDATVLTGYPGSIASAWQQAGRSGRRGERALSVLIGLDNPLDQYFMRHPEYFFGKSFENALVNPANPYILRAHLLCAAWESPLSEADKDYFGPTFGQEVENLVEQTFLRERNGRWFLSPSIAYPAQGVNIRSASGESFTLFDAATGQIMETVEAAVAYSQVHTGAIYLHQGQAYLVTRLDLATRTAYLEPTGAAYYTQARELTDLKILRVLQRRRAGIIDVFLGEVEVTTAVIGFRKKAQFSEEVIGEEPLDLPPQHFPTVALWFDLTDEAIEKIQEGQLDFPGGLHAAEHAAIGILPVFALCDRNDIGGVSTPLHPDTGRPQIFIYDAYPGGIGIAERGFEIIQDLWRTTLKLIEECPCEEGCPSCIQSPKCGNNNKPLDKKAARMLLEGLLLKRVSA